MQKAFIIVGLAFGDEGKGQTVHNLTQRYNADLIVRYNGGSQAGHNVHTSDGLHHCFSQIGSGSFNSSTKTILSKYMLIDPIALMNEANIFDEKKIDSIISDRIYISEDCKIITPYNVITNQATEYLRGNSKHGSCGKGVGDAKKWSLEFPEDTIYAKDLFDSDTLEHKLKKLSIIKQTEIEELSKDLTLLNEDLKSLFSKVFTEEYMLNLIKNYRRFSYLFNISSDEKIGQMINNSDTAIFEGAQGVLLDELYGFHPYTTWSNTTPQNAIKILEEAEFKGKKEILGIIRTYSTRHGVGPFVTENCGFDKVPTTEDNKTNDWQDNFRVGCFDEMMFRYSLDCLRALNCYPDKIVLTHQDIFDKYEKIPYNDKYKVLGSKSLFRESMIVNQLEYQEALGLCLSDGDSPDRVSYFNKQDFINKLETILGIKVYKQKE